MPGHHLRAPRRRPRPWPGAGRSGRGGFRSPHRHARQARPTAPAQRAETRRRVWRTVLSGSNTVTSGSRPRPGALPSMPCGSISASPSICRPPQTPSTAPPRAACAATARSSPCARSQARSPLVCFGAGQDDPVAGAARQLGRAAHPLQAHAGHVLERLKFVEVADARVGDHGHRVGVTAPAADAAVVKHAVFLGQAVLPPHRQRGHGGHAGQRPAASAARAPAALASPRNLFSTKPLISARSFSGSSAQVP